MKQIEIDKIITYLKTITALTALVSTRIYFGFPIKEEQGGVYIVLNIISEGRTEVNKGALVEFRIIGNTNNTTFKSLIAVRNLISDNLTGGKTMGTYKPYGIREDGRFVNGYDDKNRKTVIQDYLFYYIT